MGRFVGLSRPSRRNFSGFVSLDPVARAQVLIDDWHQRLAAGESARPSPTIATAMAAEYERLDVFCEGCLHKVCCPSRASFASIEARNNARSLGSEKRWIIRWQFEQRTAKSASTSYFTGMPSSRLPIGRRWWASINPLPKSP